MDRLRNGASDKVVVRDNLPVAQKWHSMISIPEAAQLAEVVTRASCLIWAKEG